MALLIPAINAETFEEIQERINLLEAYFVSASLPFEWVHIDVADGTFTPNALWHKASDLLMLQTHFKIEVHLMIADIDARIDEWLLPSVNRVVFHKEAGHDPFFVVDRIKNAGKETGLAILPETLWRDTQPFWDKTDLIQILGVSPGRAGQEMHKETVDKIRGLHEACPQCIIEIDGGVNTSNARECVKAGASLLVSASSVFGKKDIKIAFQELKNEINI